MAQQISCPECKATYKLPDNPQGKPVKVKCKKCDRIFTVGAGPKPGKSTPNKSNPPEPVIRQSPYAPKKREISPIILILLGLFLLLGLGSIGAAVGGYFLFIHKGQDPILAAKGDKTQPETDARQKGTPAADAKKKKEATIPKDKTPTPESKDKTPTPEPKDKPPTPEPKDKTPTPEPKDKTPTPEPKDKKTEPEPPKKDPPTPEPKDKKTEPEPPKKDPPPPAVVALYKLKDPPSPAVEIKLDEQANSIVLTPDGKKAVIGVRGLPAQERCVLVVDLATGNAKKIAVPDLIINSLALSPDGKTVLIGGDDDRFNVPAEARLFVRAHSLQNGKMTGFVKGPQYGVDHIALAPDGFMIATAESKFTGPRGVIRVINLRTGATVFYKEKVHLNVTKGLLLTPDKKYVISTGVDDGNSKSKVIVFDIATKAEKHVFTGYAGTAEGLAVSSDGKYVAAAINQGGSGGSVRVWDIETGDEKLALVTNQGNRGARSVIFGADDKTIIALFYDSTTRTFDVKTGNEEGGFRTDNLARLAKTPDGKVIVTVSGKAMQVWQFPDSLAKITKDDQPAFAQIVREGKNIAGKVPSVREDANYKIFANVTIESVQSQSVLHFLAQGADNQATLQPATKFYDVAGKPVPADQAKKIYRIGNVVTITTQKAFKSPIAALRLIKEGPAEVVVENLKLKYPIYPGSVMFTMPQKDVLVKFGPAVRYVDHLGKEMPGMIPQKFLNKEDTYAIKAHLEVGEDVPVMVEARLTPEKGQLPVFLRYPLGIVGAKGYKNALLRRVPAGKRLIFVLVPADGEPIPIFPANETKAYDVKGKEVPGREIVYYQDLKVDAVILPRANAHVLLEARALMPFSEAKPAPPPPINIVVHNNVEVGTQEGNPRHYLKIGGKKVGLSLDPNLKALDKDGKEVAPLLILHNGNRVDAKLNDVDPQATLLEVRLVNGSSVPPNAKTYVGWTVKRATKKVYSMSDGTGTLNVQISTASRAYDAAGKSVPLDQVLRIGALVDVIAEARPRGSYPLIEVRASKK